MVAYRVSVPTPCDHTLRVTVRVDQPGAALVFSIPAWTPGSYLIREFSRYLGEPRCTGSSGAPVACRKVDKGTWTVDAAGEAWVEVAYEVYAHELTVRTPHVDASHAFFTGTNALVYVHGRTAEAHALRVEVPPGWEVFCALDRSDDGAYVAPDYDTLADAPVECGPHPTASFDVLGVLHRCVFWGADDVRLDAPRLVADLAAIVEANARVFSPDAPSLPYARYDFIFHITSTGRGGLEHLNATVLATPWTYFANDEGYRDLLVLAAHEHFHVWNVKRVRPTPLGPFDYQREALTSGLWVAEGWTSYFDALVCVRSGLLSAPQYLTLLGKDLTRYAQVPGRNVQSVADASRDAWIRLYRPDANTANRTVSYYLKGSLVALCLDVRLLAGGCAGGLAGVMRTLWAEYLATGAAFDADALVGRIEALTGVAVGGELARWVYGTDPLPLDDVLAAVGVTVTRPATSRAWLGVEFDTSPAGMTVRTVSSEGPCHASDLAPGDVVVAFDGRRAGAVPLTDVLAVGRPVELTYFRRDVLRAVTVTPVTEPATEHSLALRDDVDEATAALRSAWLDPRR